MMEKVEPLIAEDLAIGAARVLAQRPSKVAKTKTFDVEWLDDFPLPEAMKLAIEAAFNDLMGQDYWQAIQRGTLLSITDTLTAGLTEGLSYPNLKKLLLDTHKGMSEVRAAAIARTETTKAMNRGHMESYLSLQADGEKLQKEWLTIQDATTRPAHADADGQVVDVNADFVVGGENIPHPGTGSAKNSVNCRCTTAAVFGD
jgi:SPP1 gp7 family putative phage head morphogenesis protein